MANEFYGNVGVSEGSKTTVILCPPSQVLSITTNGTPADKPTFFRINGEMPYNNVYANGIPLPIDRRGKTPAVSVELYADMLTGQTYVLTNTLSG